MSPFLARRCVHASRRAVDNCKSSIVAQVVRGYSTRGKTVLTTKDASPGSSNKTDDPRIRTEKDKDRIIIDDYASLRDEYGVLFPTDAVAHHDLHLDMNLSN